MYYWKPATLVVLALVFPYIAATQIGVEKAISGHLKDGEEFEIPLARLIKHGEDLFRAAWTIQDGAGRPLTRGNGQPLANPAAPLLFPRNFNRISAPDANSCFGCHNLPFVGGGGDIVTNVFVLAQRFDFVTFDPADPAATSGSRDEHGRPVTLQTVANERATLGMFGSGFIEMLARQMTADLQEIRDSTQPGGMKALVTKGVSFGILARFSDGSWDVSRVEGIPNSSLQTNGANSPPSLIIRPFHQAGRVISIREFSNNAFNHHHGIQPTERFGIGTDPDGDGVVDEMTRADVTAVSVFQATLAVPGRVIPRDPRIETAIRVGEARFGQIGCAGCHRPTLPLIGGGWIYTEPNPFNPPGNLRPGEAPTLRVDLTSDELPQPRLKPDKYGVVHVPAFTDLKLHDIGSGHEPLDMHHPEGTEGFFHGNRRFLTKKLWGAANEPPFFHHGRFVTLREAVLAHAGEALAAKTAFTELSPFEQDSIIEFLKTLQVLPPGTKSLIVDSSGNPRDDWGR